MTSVGDIPSPENAPALPRPSARQDSLRWGVSSLEKIWEARRGRSDVLQEWDAKGRGALPSRNRLNDPNHPEKMTILGELALPAPQSSP